MFPPFFQHPSQKFLSHHGQSSSAVETELNHSLTDSLHNVCHQHGTQKFDYDSFSEEEVAAILKMYDTCLKLFDHTHMLYYTVHFCLEQKLFQPLLRASQYKNHRKASKTQWDYVWPQNRMLGDLESLASLLSNLRSKKQLSRQQVQKCGAFLYKTFGGGRYVYQSEVIIWMP